MKFCMEANFMKMKNEDLILDSNVLIAFVNTSDNLHVKSVSVMKETSFRKKIISDLIFADIGTVLLMKTKQTRLKIPRTAALGIATKGVGR